MMAGDPTGRDLDRQRGTAQRLQSPPLTATGDVVGVK